MLICEKLMKINPLFIPDDYKLAEISCTQFWITSYVMSSIFNIKYLDYPIYLLQSMFYVL